MRLEILYIPTTSLDASLAYYRDVLGWKELWREGASTAALVGPDADGIRVMLDEDPTAPMGPMFVVESVVREHAALADGVEVIAEPAEIPGGWIATYREPGGSVYYLIDQSTDAQAS